MQPATKRVGLDVSLLHSLIAHAYFDPHAQTGCADLDDVVPLPDGCADVAIMVDAFHYIERPIPWQTAEAITPGPYVLRAVRGIERKPCVPRFDHQPDRCFVNPIYRELPAGLALRGPSRDAEKEFGATPLPPFLPHAKRLTDLERQVLVAKGVLVSDPSGRVRPTSRRLVQ